ncbi:hypothetical protein B0T10DRAFT_471479 [Thelonectria olida]|uniref:Secreted protein n=1 Tax=Thelonectria olida TaxID=1576542 RepID=A0A9P8WJQ6_9HYPO|nr:hypothetical protein B0T10DRAFT_471479 [Thelonectria olida]
MAFFVFILALLMQCKALCSQQCQRTHNEPNVPVCLLSIWPTRTSCHWVEMIYYRLNDTFPNPKPPPGRHGSALSPIKPSITA